MANPKRKWSKSRTGKRRSQWKLSAPNLVKCPQCHALKIPHRVCKECGYYIVKDKAVQVIKVED
ncbi:MAG TPA: 50S ribosomal protein L32 [Pseudobacteroides sp.]|jgi:large subunit ribosomal protein L32|uniref:50S ribosomal protein L32 n=1 Tax=Pseudobacteroides sp. TaxID=1968840 RepID=UPI002F9520AA